MKYAVEVDGKLVTWEDGEFTSDDDGVLEDIKAAKEAMQEEPYLSLALDGSLLYCGDWIDPESSWALSYAFLQKMTGGDMEFVAGRRPSWDALGYKEENGAVY